jgi:EAL and modified HD-GYP domain-containing signal transduction protein
MPGTDVVVGRQGVHDTNGVVGYELMFGSVPVLGSGPLTGDAMSAELLFGAMSIGLDRLVSDRLVFCNAGRGVLTGDIPVMLPPERTVLVVSGAVDLPDDEAVAGCERLARAGYIIAVADLPRWDTGLEAALDVATAAKIDVAMLPHGELNDFVRLCGKHDVSPLANHVGNHDEIADLAAMGFELFQGFGLDRPKVMRGKTLSPAAASGVLAAAELLGSEPEFEQLEKILRRDPALSYHIMQLASLGRMGETRRNINSIRDALVMAGVVQIKNWLALLLARPAGPHARAYDAMLATLLRARACELLAAEINRSLAGFGFAAGMLSALDILLEIPLDEVAESLPLSDELRDAAFGGDTPMAHIVQDVATYRPGGTTPGEHSGLPRERLDAVFARAFPWAVECAAASEQRP